MRVHLVILFVSALLTACSAVDRPGSTNHAMHNANANTVTNTPTVDHDAMGHGSSSVHSNMQSSPGAESAPYDLQFIDSMIEHHKGAVDMATLAETRAQHPELKDLAANIVSEQEREMARMSELRDKWFGEKSKAINMNFPGMSHGMGGMDMKKLESLNGGEFDIEFLKQMIPHHEGAIEMAKDLQKHDSYSELKELAGDIITAQESEIKQMREWLSKWPSH